MLNQRDKSLFRSKIITQPLGMLLLLLPALLFTGCKAGPADANDFVSLFDGKTLGSWKESDYGGQQGEVEIKGGSLILHRGDDITGVTWSGKLPATMNYEIELKAKRLEGIDFFCGLTFPVNDKSCSLIVGGWSGSIVGISSLDYQDAANNETTHVTSFVNNKWYHIRMRVTKNKLEAWLDYEKIIDTEINGRDIDTRPEVDPSKPFGICTFQTKAAIKDIELRMVDVSQIDQSQTDQ